MFENKIITKDVIENFYDEEYLSPYKFAQSLSLLAGRYVREQMIYNYIKMNYITCTISSTGKKQINKKECVRFATKYLKRNSVNKTQL